jgi:hypothetical protein
MEIDKEWYQEKWIDHCKELQEDIEIAIVVINNLLHITYNPLQPKWCSHYPIECERLLMTMKVIVDAEIKGIKINDKY